MTKRIVLLQALASTMTDLGYILNETGSGAGASERTADSWSIKDVLSHLVYVEGCYHERLRRVIEEDNPTVPQISPEETPFDETLSTAEQLSRFKEARNQTIATLKRLSPGQWQRPAIHELTGKTTLRFLLQILIEHDIEHLNQIVQLQQAARSIPVRDAQPAVENRNESNKTE
jgi:uncharacterized damage-inducible protein DinB